MNDVRYLSGCEIRRRWRAWLGTALLIGIAGAAVLGSFAGARRTASVIDRSARHSQAEDLNFGPDVNSTPRQWKNVDRLPGIATVTTARGIIAVPVANGRPDVSWVNGLTIFPVDAGLLRTVNRPQMLRGRMPRPDRAGEAFVDETFARRRHVNVGDRFSLKVASASEFSTAQSAADLPPGRDLNVVITGIGRLRDEATRDPTDPQIPPEIIFTPAATARFASIRDVSWDLKVVRLVHGRAGLAAFERRVRALLHGVPVTISERVSADARARRATRPYVVTLLAFGVLAGVASIAVIGQLLGRQQAARRADRRVLQAMGITRGRLALVGAIEGAVVGGVGALLAVAGAIALSPIAPIGPFRRLEPDPGIATDVQVLVVGAIVIVGFCIVRVTAAAAHTLVRSPAVRRVNRTVDAVTRRLPASVGTGVRLATQGGADAGAIPLRSTMVGLIAAIAAITATFVYSAGLTHFVSTPRLFGWTWDALVAPDDTSTFSQTQTAVRHDPAIRSAATGRFGQIIIRTNTIPALGVDGPPDVTIVDGRAPTHDDEIALGASSMRTARTAVGRRVTVNGPGGTHRYLVTGRAAFPRLAPYPASEPTGLGIGAAFTRAGLARLVPNAQDQFMLVTTREPGGEPTALARNGFAKRVFPSDSPGAVLGPQRPNDVTSYDRVARTPLALASLLALLALATATHVLITSVRRRRRELAVLKTLGFTRRQVSSSVAAQATTMIGVAALIALPLGVVIGEWAWGATARWLGIVTEQVIPIGILAAIAIGAIVLANLIAFVPGRVAARIRPSVALRAE